MKKIKVFL